MSSFHILQQFIHFPKGQPYSLYSFSTHDAICASSHCLPSASAYGPPCRVWWEQPSPCPDTSSNGGQVEGQAIVVPMLNGGFQPFLKEDGILNKEPIDMCTPQESDIIIHTWIAEVDMLVGLFRAPGGVEQIFRTGSYQGRLFFTVDEPHVIAFTIPHGGRALYIIIQSHKMALSLDIGKHIIVGSVLILRLLTHGTHSVSPSGSASVISRLNHAWKRPMPLGSSFIST